MTAAPPLSVVVSSYGTARLPIVARAAAHVVTRLPEAECLVLSDRPDDVQKALGATAAASQVRIIPFKGGVSAERNAGIEAARARAVLLLDDDMEPRAGWAEAALRLALGGQDAVHTGPILPQSPGGARPVALWLLGCRRVPAPRPVLSLYGGNILLSGKARALRFDTRLGPAPGPHIMHEDGDFGYRARALGIPLLGDPGLAVDHHVPPERMRTRWLLRRSFETGVTGATYVRFVRREGRSAPPARYGALAKGLLGIDKDNEYVDGERLGLRHAPFLAAATALWAAGYAKGLVRPYPRYLREPPAGGPARG